MSGGKRETDRAVAPAQAAQDVGLQGLHTEVSDFQNKLLSPPERPRDASSVSSHTKIEPTVTRSELNGAALIGAAPKSSPRTSCADVRRSAADDIARSGADYHAAALHIREQAHRI